MAFVEEYEVTDYLLIILSYKKNYIIIAQSTNDILLALYRKLRTFRLNLKNIIWNTIR